MQPKQGKFPVIGPGLSTVCTWKLGGDNKECPHTIVKRAPAPKIYDNILEAVGRTPMVKINRIPQLEGFPETEFLAKCEFLNPGGSVKDRIGKRMLIDAEESKRCKKGDTIIEPTSGNTGIGLAMSCAVMGYNCVVTLPEKMSLQKIAVLKALGSKIVRTRTEANYYDDDSHLEISLKIKESLENAHILDQYSNPGNPLAHYDETAQEIIDQCDGKIDYIVIGGGTGGTLTGIARKLKEKVPTCFIIGVDPQGSLLARPESLNSKVGTYQVEGIGYDFTPRVLDHGVVDKWYKCKDNESLNMARRLISEEGFLCGGSSGSAMECALQFAREQGAEKMKGKRMVVLLPDSIRNYLSKHVSPEWMVTHGFMSHSKAKELESQNLYKLPGWGDALNIADLDLKTIEPLRLGASKAAEALKIFKDTSVPAIPVLKLEEESKKEVLAGTVTQQLLLQSLSRFKFKLDEPFTMPAVEKFPRIIKGDVTLADSIALFGTHDALVVEEEKGYKVVSRIDVLAALEKAL